MLSRIGRLLTLAGLGVCLLGAIGLVAGAWIHLPPRTVIAIAKATPFVVGIALMIVGAFTARAARETERLATRRHPEPPDEPALDPEVPTRPRAEVRR